MVKIIKAAILLITIFIQQNEVKGLEIDKVDSLELELKKKLSPEQRLNTLFILISETSSSYPLVALEYAKEAYKISKSIGNEEYIAISADFLSNYYCINSEFELSIQYAKEAQEIALHLDNKSLIARLKISEANIYLAISDLKRSIELFYESLNLFDELGIKNGISTALNGIGIVYHEQENFAKALEYFNKCLVINEEIGNPEAIAPILNNIASCYNGMEEHDKGIRYYLEVLQINKELGHKYRECLAHINLSESYLAQNNIELSLEFVNNAYRIANEIQNPEMITGVKNQYAEYYLKTNTLDSSIAYALEALSLGNKHKFNSQILHSTEILHKAYKEIGDISNAYKYSIVHSNMKDSLNMNESIQKIARLELKYRIEKEEQKRQLEQQKKRSKQIVIIITSVSLIILLVTLLIARHRIALKNMKLQKNKIESKLEIKNKELTLNVLTLLKKNEMLTSISRDLFNVKHNAVKEETKGAISSIAKRIKKSTESEIWEEFELRFKEVHTEFYENIQSRFPDLSPGELRLCALLRLNMSSKEISQLTGKSLIALEKARYRIRKKMNLSNSSVNLVNYLSEL